MQAQEIIDLEAVAALYNLDAVALAIYADYEGFDDLEEAAREFEDHYAGTYDSVAEWAEQLADDTGLLDGVPEHLRYYFDFAAYSRDLVLNGDIWTHELPNGDIAIFWR